MDVLPIQTSTVHYVNYSDLERFIEHYYGQSFSFVADQLCSNDSCVEFDIPDEQIDEWEKEAIDKFKTGTIGTCYAADALLKDLAQQKKIPFGTYIIRVSW